MKLKDFGYDLPEELIAQEPSKKRDEARLLVVNRKRETLTHDHFYNLSQHIPAGVQLVLNNSKVIPARLLGVKERTGGKVEIFLLKNLGGQRHEVLLRPQKKIRDGDIIRFSQRDFYARVEDVDKRIVWVNQRRLLPYLEKVGHIPLPPYIKREDQKEDREFYQTVYARHAGSVAAPTAGLHFTKDMLSRLKREGQSVEHVTLHINYGTFKPVEEENITEHKMHTEIYSVSGAALGRLKERRPAHPILAVGTTSCRVLETVGRGGPVKGETNLFIYPGYRFTMTDILLTNFHLPYSSLLMLVSAFGGLDLIRRAYREAVKEKYRFYSYGDAMLIV